MCVNPHLAVAVGEDDGLHSRVVIAKDVVDPEQAGQLTQTPQLLWTRRQGNDSLPSAAEQLTVLECQHSLKVTKSMHRDIGSRANTMAVH